MEIDVLPIAGHEIGTIKDLGKVMLGLQVLKPDGSCHTIRFVMEPSQAQEIAHLLEDKARLVEQSEQTQRQSASKH